MFEEKNLGLEVNELIKQCWVLFRSAPSYDFEQRSEASFVL